MRNHFVPEFLLRAWCEATPDNALQEFRIDIATAPSRRRAPKATGFQKDLYALSAPVVAWMNQHDVETRFLKLIDNDAARVRAKLIEHGLKKLTIAERGDWARFLIAMRLRQPELVGMLKSESEQHLREELATQPDEYEEAATEAGDKMPATFEEWTEQTFPGLIAKFWFKFLR
jgi:hypothetical protein